MKHSIPICETNRAFVGNFANHGATLIVSWVLVGPFMVDSHIRVITETLGE